MVNVKFDVILEELREADYGPGSGVLTVLYNNSNEVVVNESGEPLVVF